MQTIWSLHSILHKAYICKTEEKVTTIISQNTNDIKWSIQLIDLLYCLVNILLFLTSANMPLKFLLEYLLSSHCWFLYLCDTQAIYFLTWSVCIEYVCMCSGNKIHESKSWLCNFWQVTSFHSIVKCDFLIYKIKSIECLKWIN